MDSVLALIDKAGALGVLTRTEAEAVMEELLSGHMGTPEIVRLLLAMNLRTVTAEELAGFAFVMRRHAVPVFAEESARPEKMLDTCGTGGDNSGTFNISTASAIVAAAAGARVAKHGNRSATSRSGSADVLEALGVRLDLPMAHFGEAIKKIGIGFFFAPAVHSAARHAAPARKQIAERTVFNLLGPLTNPAGAHRQLVGVYSASVMDCMAQALLELQIERAFVVHGAGGLDEISLAGESQIAEVRNGRIRRFSVTPEDFTKNRAPLSAIAGGSPQENALLLHGIFAGEAGPRRDIVVINAAAALVLTDDAKDFRTGAVMAEKAITSGAALKKLQQLIAFTNQPDPSIDSAS
jgi:anthranilate phosphoribosyltransferase